MDIVNLLYWNFTAQVPEFLLWTHGPTAVQEQYGKKEKRP